MGRLESVAVQRRKAWSLECIYTFLGPRFAALNSQRPSGVLLTEPSKRAYSEGVVSIISISMTLARTQTTKGGTHGR